MFKYQSSSSGPIRADNLVSKLITLQVIAHVVNLQQSITLI